MSHQQIFLSSYGGSSASAAFAAHMAVNSTATGDIATGVQFSAALHCVVSTTTGFNTTAIAATPAVVSTATGALTAKTLFASARTDTVTATAVLGSSVVTLAAAAQVASTSSGTLTDNLPWLTGTLPESQNWVGAGYSSDLSQYLLVSSVSFLTADDGVHWTSTAAPSAGGGTFNCPTWGSGASKWLITAFGASTSSTSSDGLSWTSHSMPTTGTGDQWLGAAWDGNTFVAVTSDGLIGTSPTGATWTSRTAISGFAGSTTQVIAADPVNHILVTVDFNGNAYRSTNAGVTFSSAIALPSTSGTWLGVVFNGSKFVSVSTGSSDAAYSGDGTSWTLASTGSNSGWNNIGVSGTEVFTGDGTVEVSTTNGASFGIATLPVSKGWQAMTGGGTSVAPPVMVDVTSPSNVFVHRKASSIPLRAAVSATPAYSVDLTTVPATMVGAMTVVSTATCALTTGSSIGSWTQGTLPQNDNYVGLNWNGSKFLAVAPTYFLTSTDGVTWTDNASPAGFTWCRPAWNGSVWCIVGYTSANAYTSSNGITWTSHALPATGTGDQWLCVTWDGTAFIAFAADGKIATSNSTGTSWSAQSDISGFGSGQEIDSNGTGTSVIISYDGHAYTSTNHGVSFTAHALPSTTAGGTYTVCRWNGTVFATVAGPDTRGATSTDGATWTSRTMPSNSNWFCIGVNGSEIMTPIYGSTSYVGSVTNMSTFTTSDTLPVSDNWGICAGDGSTVAVMIPFGPTDVFVYRQP